MQIVFKCTNLAKKNNASGGMTDLTQIGDRRDSYWYKTF